jgi:hypothetical protein
MTVLDVTPETSIEQPIGALNKKTSMEYARVQATMPPMSRAHCVIGVEVRVQKPLEGNPRY